MRNLEKQTQEVWFCKVEEKNIGFDRVKIYTQPVKKRYTVSWGSGEIPMMGSGFNVDYDRQITCFNSDFYDAEEGMMVFVDVVPKIGEDGFLELSEDGYTPVTKPDYICNKILETQKGTAKRIFIKKV